MAGWCDDSVQPNFIIGEGSFIRYQDFALQVSDDEEPFPLTHVKENKRDFVTIDGVPIRTLFVSRIAKNATWNDVMYTFGKFGPIFKLYFRKKKRSSFAFVTYRSTEDALAVFERHRVRIKSTTAFIAIADSWHQPVEGPDGTLIWKKDKETCSDEEEEDADDIVTQVVEENSLNKLNDDCLLHIFSFLNYQERIKAERVCKRWRAVMMSLWRRVSILDFSQPEMIWIPRVNSVLECLLKRCNESLRVLNLKCKHAFEESILAIVGKYCRNIEELSVNRLYLSRRSLPYLARYCTKLKKIELLDCNNLTDSDLMKCFADSEALTSITVRGASKLDGRCLIELKTPVEYINLSNCNRIDPNYLMTFIQLKASSLKHLLLNSRLRICGKDIQCICETLPNLLSLELGSLYRTYKNSLVPIRDLSQLQSLSLIRNNTLNKETIFGIVQGCKNLVSLDISGCKADNSSFTKEDLIKIGRLRKLTEINISYLYEVDDDCLKSLIAKCTPCHFKVIKCVGCHNVTDVGCTQVVSLCHELELFDISGNLKITNETVKTALDSVKMNSNRKPLTLIVGGTRIDMPSNDSRLIVLSENSHSPLYNIMDAFFLDEDMDLEMDVIELCHEMDDESFVPPWCNYHGSEVFEGWDDLPGESLDSDDDSLDFDPSSYEEDYDDDDFVDFGF